MAWQDRPYYRDSSSGPVNPLLWLFSGSVPLFTAFGIRVRMHASMVLLIIITLLTAGAAHGIGVWNAVTFSVTLFSIILLHEFGHCFAARSVGGEAKDILMWPLGGLAFADAPQRWWPQFFTAAGGPLVNVGICVLTGLGLVVLGWARSVPWNPLSHHFFPPYGAAYYFWFVFVISWGNLLFNLVPVYPLDGGRLLQAGLWSGLGYYRATLISCSVGMVGAVLMMLWGVVSLGSWSGMVLFFIGLSCFIYCFQLRAAVRAAGPWGVEQDQDTTDYSAAYDINAGRPPKKRKSRWFAGRAAKRARKIAAHERAERQKIDDILAKLSAQGMSSLTWREKRTLKRATERQRQRDAELSEILKK